MRRILFIRSNRLRLQFVGIFRVNKASNLLGMLSPKSAVATTSSLSDE